MATVYVLPFDPNEEAAYVVGTQLDGVSYIFGVSYNERTESYYVDVFTSEGVEVVKGLRVVCDFALARRYRKEGFPDGVVVARSLVAGNDEAPKFGELGARVRVLFIPEADIVRAQAAAPERTIIKAGVVLALASE